MEPRASVQVAEVVLCYGDTILDVHHVPARTRAGTAGCYTLGEDPAADLTVSGAALPNAERFVLVRGNEDASGFMFEFCLSMRGKLICADARHSLASLVERGTASACGDHFSHPLPLGARAILQLGDGPLHIYLRTVSAAELAPSRTTVDLLWCACVGGSASVIIAMLLMMFSLPPQRLSLVEPSRFVHLLLPPPIVHTEPELEPPEPEPPESETLDPDERDTDEATPEHGSNKRLRAQTPASTRRDPGRALHNPRTRPDPLCRLEPGRYDTDEGPSNAGILAFTGPYMERFAAMGRHAYTPDSDDRELWEDMTKGDPPEYTVGGVGLGHTQRGTRGEGVIGLGNTGLIGRGSYGRVGDVPHAIVSHFGRRKHTRHVFVRETSALGQEDTQVARRIIRSHHNELESCYRSNTPHASSGGKVVLSFMVSAEGHVRSSATKRSDIHAPSFERCLNSAVKRWRFTRPRWGMAQFELSLDIRP